MIETPFLTQRLEQIKKAQTEASRQRLIADLISEFKKTALKVTVDNFKDKTSIDNLDEVKLHLRNELKPLLKALEDINVSTEKGQEIAKSLESEAITSIRSDFDIVMVRKPKLVDVNVTNLKDTPLTKDVSVNNQIDYTKDFKDLQKVIKDTFNIDIPTPKVTVQPTPVTIPETQVNIPEFDLKPLKEAIKEIKITLQGFKKPKNPMAVRLTDGEEFIDALHTMVDNQQQFFDGSANTAPILKSIQKLISTNSTIPKTIVSGKKAVATAGTAVQVTTESIPCKVVWVNADLGSTSPIVVGDSSVVAADDSQQGIILIPGNSPIPLEINNLNTLWVDAQTTGDILSYAYTT